MSERESEQQMRAYWEQVTHHVLGKLLEQRQEFHMGPMEAAEIAVEVADFLCAAWDERSWASDFVEEAQN